MQEACGHGWREKAMESKARRLSREGRRKRMFLDPCGVLPITPAFWRSKHDVVEAKQFNL